MTLYEENIKLLGKVYPDMDELIEKARKNVSDRLEIIEEAYDENVVLKIKKDGKECYLHSKRNYRDPAQRWVDSVGTLYPNAPVFVVGVGNVTYLEELIERTENKILLFVYEPSIELFVYFLKHYDLQKWMEKQTIVFWVQGLEGMDFKALEPLIRSLIKYENIHLSRRLIVPNYDVLFPEETLQFMKICKEIADYEVVLKNTKSIYSDVIAKNLLNNLKHLVKASKTIQFAEKVPQGIPGIVVAAGPSLNKNIKELKKAQGKAFIIATDTAIKPLLREGIIPDMITVIDGVKPIELFQAEGAEKIPLLSMIVAASDVLDFHKGKKIFCDEGYAIMEDILCRSEIGFSPLPIGGSVATVAFAFLYMIGVDTIILVGQDLAYTNGRTHADGTFKDKMPEVDTSYCVMCEGNYEKEVPVPPDMKTYLDWYDKYIEGFKGERESFRVINATEGGAKIKGTEVISLKDAIEAECTQDVDMEKIIADVPSMFSMEEEKWVLAYIRGLPQECQRLMLDARKAKTLYEKLDKICSTNDLDTKKYLSVMKQLRKILKKIEDYSVYDLVSESLSEAQYILKNEQFMEFGTVQEEGKEIARKGILYMDNVYECANVFKEFLEEVYKDL